MQYIQVNSAPRPRELLADVSAQRPAFQTNVRRGKSDGVQTVLLRNPQRTWTMIFFGNNCAL
jgi:hypothetical protein